MNVYFFFGGISSAFVTFIYTKITIVTKTTVTMEVFLQKFLFHFKFSEKVCLSLRVYQAGSNIWKFLYYITAEHMCTKLLEIWLSSLHFWKKKIHIFSKLQIFCSNEIDSLWLLWCMLRSNQLFSIQYYNRFNCQCCWLQICYCSDLNIVSWCYTV